MIKRLLIFPSWSAIIVLGLVIRLYTAHQTIDILHADQHFQTLEPAAHLVFGWGWMSWEWQAGLRSWFVPGLYAMILWPCKILGLTSGPLLLQICRAATALLSTAAIWGFARLLLQRGISILAGWVALALFAFTPVFIRYAPATLSDTLAMDFLWLAMPLIFWTINQEKKLFWWLAGFALGWTFLTRVQMLFWAVALLATAVVLLPRARKHLHWAAFGYCVPVLFQGALDWATWGRPFNSLIVNVQKNWVENVASFYGVSPWYEYFKGVPADWDTGFTALFVLSLVILFIRFQKALRREDGLIFIPAIFFVGMHCLVPHKEMRFLLPLYPVAIYSIALAIQAVLPARLLKFNFQPWMLAAMIPVLGGLAWMSAPIATDPKYYPMSNMSELPVEIWKEGKLQPNDCVLIVGQYWIWTHGELLQGKPYRYVESRLNDLSDDSLRNCVYAIVLPQWESYFAARARAVAPSWHPVKQSYWGYLLYSKS